MGKSSSRISNGTTIYAVYTRDPRSPINSSGGALAAASEPEDFELVPDPKPEHIARISSKELDVHQASKLRDLEARKWFARQLMLPKWMIDVPDRLPHDWFASL
ncbi:hypothetical protein TorRG33x02_252620 [Trema orientale]|uniref:Uncharacterized protein n=1 Tax=Trema orientale TaxID=63057 RepID=A0A2P5DFS0_TREOI|nr:hypothetical protein TorRG33x02_252620 [Trema orientale]